MDFEINGEMVSELASELETAASSVNDNVSAVYAAIDAMNEAWSGPSYDDFKATANGYKAYLDAITENYHVWSQLVVSIIYCQYISDFFNEIEKAYSELGGS